ncbi:MAG: hypothetical protein EBE86_012515 [Hormoscilla sp. GUM202]|nr:hypothetical protein [Hormoscilla sp. GUM202]
MLLVLYLLNWIASAVLLHLPKVSPFLLETSTLKSLRRNIRSILILTGAVLCLLLVSANSWLIYQGENLHRITRITLALLRQLPWVTLGTEIAKSIGIIALAAYLFHPPPAPAPRLGICPRPGIG